MCCDSQSMAHPLMISQGLTPFLVQNPTAGGAHHTWRGITNCATKCELHRRRSLRSEVPDTVDKHQRPRPIDDSVQI